MEVSIDSESESLIGVTLLEFCLFVVFYIDNVPFIQIVVVSGGRGIDVSVVLISILVWSLWLEDLAFFVYDSS
jgi:hypothetical protein